MKQVERDELYLKMAAMFAEKSTCLRGHTGAVIVQGGRICGTGFNGAPPGLPHCIEAGCGGGVIVEDGHNSYETFPNGCTRATHAEANAVAYAARHGISTEGGTMYCTHSPCVACAHVLASSGICRLVFTDFYRVREPLHWLTKIMEVEYCGTP